MAERNDGGPAFPLKDAFMGNDPSPYDDHGMTLRDYFAGQALASMLASGQFLDPTGLFMQNGAVAVAEGAYLLADAMLAERAKGGAS